MNPIHAINQEFTRVVVEEWSEEAPSCQRVESVSEQQSRLGAATRSLLTWVATRITRQPRASVAALGREAAQR